MTDMIENCCFASPSQTEPDTQTITRRALLAVLPMVLEQELSPRQRTCLRAFYVDGKSQTEIARRLGLSQATVSYHIHAAKAAANRLLHYCQIAVAKANDWKQRTTDSDPSICTDDTAAASLRTPRALPPPTPEKRTCTRCAAKRTAHLSSSYEVRYILCVFLCIH